MSKMPSLMLNPSTTYVDKSTKPIIIAPDIPLARGGINPLSLPPKPNMIKMPDIKLPPMPLLPQTPK
jgi:hypothetical protein